MAAGEISPNLRFTPRQKGLKTKADIDLAYADFRALHVHCLEQRGYLWRHDCIIFPMIVEVKPADASRRVPATTRREFWAYSALTESWFLETLKRMEEDRLLLVLDLDETLGHW